MSQKLVAQARQRATELEHGEHADEARKRQAQDDAALLRRLIAENEKLQEEQNEYLPKISELLTTRAVLLNVTITPLNGGVTLEGPNGWELVLDAAATHPRWKGLEDEL
jgi:hypothetical protein